jgi:hypothetical protein
MGLIAGFLAFCPISTSAADGSATPSRASSSQHPASISTGFASPARTCFAPILDLASPGPERAQRAMAALDRQIDFERVVLHPKYSPALETLFEKIPPRNSTLIRAASMYSREDIPWNEINGTHELCAEGYPRDGEFYVTTSPSCEKPEQPFRLGAYLALRPPPGVALTSTSPPSVVATFGGRLKTDTFGFGALVDAIAQSLTEVYGDLAPPWDTAPGVYNHHDVAARDRFRRDLPNLDDKFHQYFKYNNILDEFDRPGGAYVLFNFAGEVQADALKKFPDLHKFYLQVAPVVTTEFDLMDESGDYWMRNGFDHGRIWLIFMVREGKLSAFDKDYHPVGEPLDLASLRRGVNHSQLSIRVMRMGMTFGLDNVRFENIFTRTPSRVSFQAHMEAVPRVVAPPGIQQGVEFLAGEFMQTMAQGSGGMHSEVASQALPDGTIRFSSEVSAEFMYSPALEFLARIADSIADKDDAKVRMQERALAQEFLESFVKDYNNARSGILALDNNSILTK